MSAPTPFYADDAVTLYRGDMREILPALNLAADVCVTDPPYAETAFVWDKWPDRWPSIVAGYAPMLWCFGSLRMFMERSEQFTAAWKFSQDIVWRKNNGNGVSRDRFRRYHELITLWYTGKWGDRYRDTPRVPAKTPAGKTHRRTNWGAQYGFGGGPHTYVTDGMAYMPSVIEARKIHRGHHPTEKPVELLTPLITYACPPGGVVLDPFAGSGSTAVAARAAGRRAVLIEADDTYCQLAAARLTALAEAAAA